MTEFEKSLIKAAGLSEEDFQKQKLTDREVAEEAYLKATYNEILIEILMEG